MRPTDTAARSELVERALGQGWYHTIPLGDGVVTPGGVDLRGPAARVLPADLSGQRALDVGTFDGFWAFELERRGADVVAADLDRFDAVEWPPPARERLAREAADRGPGERFGLAHQILGSRVTRVISSIYDLEPERLGGAVDFVVLGALLLHLRDPVRGLERVHSVLRPGGRLLLAEPFDLRLTATHPRTPVARLESVDSDYNWWRPNMACLHSWVQTAGFEGVERRARFRLKATKTMRQWCTVLEARRSA